MPLSCSSTSKSTRGSCSLRNVLKIILTLRSSYYYPRPNLRLFSTKSSRRSSSCLDFWAQFASKLFTATSFNSLAQKVFARSIMVFRTKCDISKRINWRMDLTCVVHEGSHVLRATQTRNKDGPRWDLFDFKRRFCVGILVFSRRQFRLFSILLSLCSFVNWFSFLNRCCTLCLSKILNFDVALFLPKSVVWRILRVLPLYLKWLWLCMLDSWHTPWNSALQFQCFIIRLLGYLIFRFDLGICSLYLLFG